MRFEGSERKGAYLMGLTDLYRKGERILREKEYGWVLDAVETGFVITSYSIHYTKLYDPGGSGRRRYRQNRPVGNL